MEQDPTVEAAFGTSGVESTTTTTSQPTHEPILSPQYWFLAGIGAMATAYDEAESWYDRFVRRGREVQDEWRDRAEDVRLQSAGTRYRMRDALRSTMDAFLDTMNVPNKGDVDTINLKLNVLTRKIDDLHVQNGGDTAPKPATPPPPTTTDLAT